MHNLEPEAVRKALNATGERLADEGVAGPIRIVLCGALALMVRNALAAGRRTLDCDVIAHEPADAFVEVAAAARAVADRLGLPANWLNDEASAFAYLLPLGWRDRVSALATFGPLEVQVLARFDLLALKLVGAASRPQDLEDIEQMRPTPDELDRLAAHLDRLEAEALDGRTYEAQRQLLAEMRHEP